jgi:ubiquitin carboxyl-terminal hydrolase 8
MGVSCSKVDGTSSVQSVSNNREEVSSPSSRQQQRPLDMPPTTRSQSRQSGASDSPLGEYSRNGGGSPTPPDHTTKRRRNSIRRVGSDRNLDGGLRASLFRMRTPLSPSLRASNYNSVHDAVAVNFREAESERQRARGGGLPLGVTGLSNLGNTCFLNSSIQCLSATIPLTDYFLGYDYKSEINRDSLLGTKGKLVTAYAELMKTLWLVTVTSGRKSRNGNVAVHHDGGSYTVIRPLSFKSQLEQFAPQFRGYSQHDAHELVCFMLDGIHEDLNRIKKKPYIEDRDGDGTNDEADAIEAWKNYLRRDKSLIVDIFQGQLRNTCVCLSCGHKNIRFEPFMYLSLPINRQCRTLDDCLSLYLSQDQLTGENQWYCEKCKTHRDATKKTDLWILPPILIVHLKRFRVNDYGQRSAKEEKAIEYPLAGWDLATSVRSQGSEYPVYDLYAISNHTGGLASGHYTAYTLNRFDDQWYEYNDSKCRRVNERILQGNRSSAYLLFYNRAPCPDDSSHSIPDVAAAAAPRVSPAGIRHVPLVRRQSVNRPDLWPHTQVQDRQFRSFMRSPTASRVVSIRHQLPPPPIMGGEPTLDMNEEVDAVLEDSEDEIESPRKG